MCEIEAWTDNVLVQKMAATVMTVHFHSRTATAPATLFGSLLLAIHLIGVVIYSVVTLKLVGIMP